MCNTRTKIIKKTLIAINKIDSEIIQNDIEDKKEEVKIGSNLIVLRQPDNPNQVMIIWTNNKKEMKTKNTAYRKTPSE